MNILCKPNWVLSSIQFYFSSLYYTAESTTIYLPLFYLAFTHHLSPSLLSCICPPLISFSSISHLLEGFKKRKAGSDNKNSNSNNNGMETNNKKGTVFDFLNKIPSSTAVSGNASLRKSGGVVKSSTSSSLAPKKDLKKMTAKSAF